MGGGRQPQRLYNAVRGGDLNTLARLLAASRQHVANQLVELLPDFRGLSHAFPALRPDGGGGECKHWSDGESDGESEGGSEHWSEDSEGEGGSDGEGEGEGEGEGDAAAADVWAAYGGTARSPRP
jgi:hypothetical protein